VTFTAVHQGASHRICPFFPNLTWNYLDDVAVSGLAKLLPFAEMMFRAKS
jgi:hypothetical protein